MKRTILIVAASVIVLSAGAWLFARSPRERNEHALVQARQMNTVTVAAVRSDGVPRGFRAIDGSTNVSNLIAHQRRFIELAMQKAGLLKESELIREVATLEGEVKRLDAEDKALAREYDGWNQATEAIRVLQTILARDPGTKAAEAANAAIGLLQERRNQTEQRERVSDPMPIQKSLEPAPAKPALK